MHWKNTHSQSTRHSYWIPTNRLIKPSLSSYVQEVDYWWQLTNEVIPIYVLDSGNQHIETQNRGAIKHIAQQYPELRIQHLSFERQSALVGELLSKANLDQSYSDCFVPKSVNYGAVMNKIALLACSLGSDCIHRRDSDTTLQRNCPYPLEAEMSALRSREINDVTTNSAPLPLAAIGSSYVGEWSMDLKPFIKASPDLFSVFWNCLGVDAGLHDDIHDLLSSGATDFYKYDDVNATDENGFYLPDAGNVAFSPIYQLFPSLPSNAMSSDYMLFRFARGCGIKSLFHQRRVVHEYHADRGEHVHQYLLSLLKYCDLRPVYTAYERAIKSEGLNLEFTTLANNGAKFAQLLNDITEQNTKQRTQALKLFIDDFISQRYPDWAEKSKVSAQNILTECNADYQKHIRLIRCWQPLMKSARGTRNEL